MTFDVLWFYSDLRYKESKFRVKTFFGTNQLDVLKDYMLNVVFLYLSCYDCNLVDAAYKPPL